MKKISLLFFTFTFLAAFTSCQKPNCLFTNGYYSGSFSYHGQVYFAAIYFDDETYKEVPSVEVVNQKFPCLTEGKFDFGERTIRFIPDFSPDCSCAACILTGDYELIREDDKITFTKGHGNDLQTYVLTLKVE